jgi:hypothetical protein
MQKACRSPVEVQTTHSPPKIPRKIFLQVSWNGRDPFTFFSARWPDGTPLTLDELEQLLGWNPDEVKQKSLIPAGSPLLGVPEGGAR